MDKPELLALLGVPETEVSAFEDSPAGEIVTTTDGVRYIHCDAPDAEGKTGLMFLTAPTETYEGTFPVYAQPGGGDTDAEDESTTGGPPKARRARKSTT